MHSIRRKCSAAIVLYVVITVATSMGQAAAPTVAEPLPEWLGGFASGGYPHRMWSTKEYCGYHALALGIFKEWQADPHPLGPIPFSRNWRLMAKVEHFYGSIRLVELQVPEEDRDEGPYYKDVDHYQLATLLSRRWIVGPQWWVHPTANLGAGLSVMNKKLIDDGSLHNFNFEGGFGLEWRLGNNWIAGTDVEWKHFSNGGHIYLTDQAVIGLEDVNYLFSLRRRF